MCVSVCEDPPTPGGHSVEGQRASRPVQIHSYSGGARGEERDDCLTNRLNQALVMKRPTQKSSQIQDSSGPLVVLIRYSLLSSLLSSL